MEANKQHTEEPAKITQELPEEPTKEPAEEPSEKKPAPKVTSTVKKTKPMKNPGRVAAGKRLAQHNRKVKDAKVNRQKGIDMDLNVCNENNGNSSSSFSLTQVLSAVSIVVSLAGLYYKREELMSLIKPKKIERAACSVSLSITVTVSVSDNARDAACSSRKKRGYEIIKNKTYGLELTTMII